MPPPRQAPPDLTYATVHKEREKGRVVAITLAVVLGTWQAVAAALKRSGASRTVNTSFVERHHVTDRHHNARKSRKTYRFSKDWRMHEAMTYFTMDTLSILLAGADAPRADLGEVRGGGSGPPRCRPGLADHVWSLANG